jgi:hypothetical protein
MINISQFIFLLPLLCIPFQSAKSLYAEGIRYTKGSFGNLLSERETMYFDTLAADHAPLVLMSQWFAPTKIVLTFETVGKGRISESELEKIVVRDPDGSVVSLRLPNKSVFISNHQVRTLPCTHIVAILRVCHSARSTPTGGISGVLHISPELTRISSLSSRRV